MKWIALILGLFLLAGQAVAQQNAIVNYKNGTTNVPVSPTNPLPTTSTASVPSNVTPTDCSGTITSGGAAQNAFAAQSALHGFQICNIDSTSGSGEPLWFSMTTTAAASGTGSYPLAAPAATTFAGPGCFTTPVGLGTNHALSVIAATTSHKFSCTWW